MSNQEDMSFTSSTSNTIPTRNEKIEDEEVASYDKDMGVPSTYNYKEDPNHPMNWSKSKKSILTLITSLNAFIGYFSSAVYMPATLDIMAYFNTNLTTINATVALYLLMNAIAPLIFAPLSEKVGRKWIYFFGSLLYSICTVICGISTSLGLFFAFRLLQGIFGSIGQALGGGSMSDIFEPHERGKAMSIYIFATILGPALGPLIGGYIDQYLSWRWIFYVKAIFGGVITLLNLFVLKETLYIPNSNTLPKPTNFKERIQRLKFNPFTCLKLLTKPEVAFVTFPISVGFGWYYYMVTILPATFSAKYHFAAGAIGLCYLASGVGNTLSAIFNGLISDSWYARSVRKNGGEAVKEFRLQPMYIGVPIFVSGSLMYGWFLQYTIHWIGALIVYGAAAFGMMFTITVANTYLVDINPSQAASVVASNNLTRNICGMIFSLTAVNIRASLDDGWSYTLLAIMCFVSYMICIPIVQRYGSKWRESSQ